MPIEKSAKIIDFMEKQDYIPRSFVDKVRDFYKEKEDNTKTIRIFPTLSDIMLDNLYKICENDVEYFVPLWHHELIYDNHGQDLCVEIHPQLEENIMIDENNHVHIVKTFTIQELWNNEKIELNIGNKKISFPRENLKLTKQQTISIPNNGIALINNNNVYDVSKRGSIFIHIALTLN